MFKIFLNFKIRYIVALFMFAIVDHTFTIHIFTRKASDCVITEYTLR